MSVCVCSMLVYALFELQLESLTDCNIYHFQSFHRFTSDSACTVYTVKKYIFVEKCYIFTQAEKCCKCVHASQHKSYRRIQLLSVKRKLSFCSKTVSVTFMLFIFIHLMLLEKYYQCINVHVAFYHLPFATFVALLQATY